MNDDILLTKSQLTAFIKNEFIKRDYNTQKEAAIIKTIYELWEYMLRDNCGYMQEWVGDLIDDFLKASSQILNTEELK